MHAIYNIKNCIHLLFICPVRFYISAWNSVCKLKMIYTIILSKVKFTGLTKPELRGRGLFAPPPVTLEACKKTVTHEGLKWTFVGILPL